MGWDEQMINDLSELLDFLRDLREQSSVEAVAWAVGQWTAGGVQADVAVEAATDVAVRRLVSCVEQRPRDFQVRGRLCVGLAGFQRQLGEFHTRLVQRCLQEAWTGTPLPHSGAPVGSALHAGTAADFLREARDRVRGGPAEGRTTTTERTERPSASPEPAGDESGDDELTLMQLTMEEENELARLGLDDGLRSALRELLRGLRVQEDRGVGAEYRWGVNQVLDACEVARRACGVVERILRDRATSSQVMRCWPAQRIPAFGPLRSRVGSFMGQYRHLVTSVFDRELGRALQDLVGCPAEDAVHGPWLPRGRGRGTMDTAQTIPRGSRSRSRTPPGGDASSTLPSDSSGRDVGGSTLVAGGTAVVPAASSGTSTCTSGGDAAAGTGGSASPLVAGSGAWARSTTPGVSSSVLGGGAVAGDGPALPVGGAASGGLVLPTEGLSEPAGEVPVLPALALLPGGGVASTLESSPQAATSGLPTGVSSLPTRLQPGVVLVSSSSTSSEDQ